MEVFNLRLFVSISVACLILAADGAERGGNGRPCTGICYGYCEPRTSSRSAHYFPRPASRPAPPPRRPRGECQCKRDNDGHIPETCECTDEQKAKVNCENYPDKCYCNNVKLICEPWV
nr:PREDICTED: uncharacterized protein LOC109036930 [Bemisia tabaci]